MVTLHAVFSKHEKYSKKTLQLLKMREVKSKCVDVNVNKKQSFQV